jgi:hypothetical protein
MRTGQAALPAHAPLMHAIILAQGIPKVSYRLVHAFHDPTKKDRFPYRIVGERHVLPISQLT